MDKHSEDRDLQLSKRPDEACIPERRLEQRQEPKPALQQLQPRLPFATDKPRESALSDEAIALAFSYHFTWGYPDYMRDALRLVSDAGGLCERLGIDPKRDLTWKQLRIVIEEADSTKIRYMVAGNPKTSASVLNYLADDRDIRVVRRVAENRNCHASTLARLAMSPDDNVRMYICENPSAPELVLLSLTRDPHLDVRYALAENIHAPISVIELLTMDENPYIADRAQRTLNVLNPAEILVPDFSRVARRRIGRAANLSS